MKTLRAVVILLAGCSTIPPAMNPDDVRDYMHTAAQLSGRQESAKLPTVYVIADPWLFFKLTCRERRILCGLGVAGAVYVPYEQVVLVNRSVMHDEDFGAVLVHELTHHLQKVQRDKRPCIDREYEAYKAGFTFSPDRRDSSLYERALTSCSMGEV